MLLGSFQPRPWITATFLSGVEYTRHQWWNQSDPGTKFDNGFRGAFVPFTPMGQQVLFLETPDRNLRQATPQAQRSTFVVHLEECRSAAGKVQQQSRRTRCPHGQSLAENLRHLPFRRWRSRLLRRAWLPVHRSQKWRHPITRPRTRFCCNPLFSTLSLPCLHAPTVLGRVSKKQ